MTVVLWLLYLMTALGAAVRLATQRFAFAVHLSVREASGTMSGRRNRPVIGQAS